MYKICQLCAVDFTAYHLLRPLGVALRNEGFDVSFCSTDGAGLEKLASEGFRVFPVEIKRNYNLVSHMGSFLKLLTLFRREKFDVVHAHTPVAGLLGRIAARMAGIPIVVYTAHGFYFHENMHGFVRKVFVGLEKLGARCSELVFIQSREDFEEALRERIAPEDKLVHIGNGVDPSDFGKGVYAERREELLKELGIKGGRVVGFVGRIVHEKGAVDFVKAAGELIKDFPDTEFVMVGSPLESDRDSCLHEVLGLKSSLGLGERLKILGYRDDVPALMSIFDLFVLPSYREGMPRVLIEAMASSLPVVATNIRGCREEVVDGVTGILIEPGDIRALCSAMKTVLSKPELARDMGTRGRERVLELFDEKEVIAKQIEYIKHLIEEARKDGRLA